MPAILFDLYGTLLNTGKGILNSFRTPLNTMVSNL